MSRIERPATQSLCLESSVPGVRLDKYLSQTVAGYSRAYLRKLIDSGRVSVNGLPTKASQRLSEGDRIVVRLPGGGSQCSAQAAPLAVVYEDREVLVVDKPAGLVVHPGPGQSGETLLSAILAHCPSVGLSDDSVRPGIAHRLDKNTSGLMVVAKNDAAREHLVSQFKDRSVAKEYLVLVKGRLSPEEGVIEGPIGRNPRSRVRMAIVVGGKDASTRYRVREYVGDHSLIEVVPVTGRTHQIRVHLSAIGHPVVGDSTYGVSSPVVDRQFVHAHRLGFRLPSNRQYREFTSPLPSDLSEALRLLGARV